MSVLPVDFLVSAYIKVLSMNHGYIRVLCIMSHYCVVSNIWESMELVKAGINRPVFTKECYLFVESWFFTHSYVAMTYENP